MDIDSLDYSRMLVNPMVGDPGELYPDIFKKHKEFSAFTLLDHKKLFRYIPLVYDKNSPLHGAFNNELRRIKVKAAEIAGFIKEDSGRYDTEVEKVMQCGNVDVNKMIVKYGILHRSTKWMDYVMIREVHSKESENLLSGKTKIEDFKKISVELESLSMDILAQDNKASLIATLEDYYIEDHLELRPEDIARNIQDGREPVPAPEKKKVAVVRKKYETEDEYVVLNEDPDLHPTYIKLPKCPDITQIDGYGLDPKNQKFTQTVTPPKLQRLINQCEKLEDIWTQLEINQLEYKKEIRWIQDQWYYSLNGYWFFCKGKPTYITGWHYDYLNHWKFSGGISPEYRDRDRKLYHGIYYAYTAKEKPKKDEDKKLVYKDPEKRILEMVDVGRRIFLGYIGPKGRRAGDSNKFLCALYKETITHPEKYSAIISNTGKHAKKNLFDEILVVGWRQMPFFYRPITSSNVNPNVEIKFVGGRKKADSAKKEDQLGSTINVSMTSTSAGLDGSNVFFLDADETGKTVECDVYERHQQLKECVSQGASINITGFIGMPSTVGEMEGGGGRKFQHLCNDSKFEERMISGQTTTGLMLIYISCLEGMQGFIDEYGFSVVDTPAESIKGIDGQMIRLGAREHVEGQRAKYLADGNIEKYNEECRKFPIWYRECFRTTDGEIGFNTKIINERLDELNYCESEKIVRGNFVPEDRGNPDSRIIWEASETGRFYRSLAMSDHASNRFFWDNMQRYPIDPKFISGADTFKFDQTEWKGMSDGGGATLWLFDPSIDQSKDIKHWKTNRFVCTYRFRPKTTKEYCEDMLSMCRYYNSMMYPENDIPKIWEHFESRGYRGYLKFDIDLATGKPKSTPGYSTTHAKQDIFNGIRDYIEKHGHREWHRRFLMECKNIQSMSEMTDYDLLAACGGALLGAASHHRYDRITVEMQKPKDISNYVSQKTYKLN